MVQIDWNDSKAFKTWNYKYIHEDVGAVITDAVAVLLGDYSIYRKQAALLLLKALCRDKFLKSMFENKSLYPYDRNDSRVKAWTNKIVSKGRCELCGETETLEAHHIIKWADYPQGRIDINNGMCLCHGCHTEEHKYDQSYHMMKAKCG